MSLALAVDPAHSASAWTAARCELQRCHSTAPTTLARVRLPHWRVAESRRLCPDHLQQLHAAGMIEEDSVKKCIIDPAHGTVRARGMCSGCYSAGQKSGLLSNGTGTPDAGVLEGIRAWRARSRPGVEAVEPPVVQEQPPVVEETPPPVVEETSPPVVEETPPPVAVEELKEGSTCPVCHLGSLDINKNRGCSCHINPPCDGCVENFLACPTCGWEQIDGIPADKPAVASDADLVERRRKARMAGLQKWFSQPVGAHAEAAVPVVAELRARTFSVADLIKALNVAPAGDPFNCSEDLTTAELLEVVRDRRHNLLVEARTRADLTQRVTRLERELNAAQAAALMARAGVEHLRAYLMAALEPSHEAPAGPLAPELYAPLERVRAQTSEIWRLRDDLAGVTVARQALQDELYRARAEADAASATAAEDRRDAAAYRALKMLETWDAREELSLSDGLERLDHLRHALGVA